MTISKQDLTLGVIAVLAISITAPSLVAAQTDHNWTGLADTDWFNSDNWSTFSTPGADDNAFVGTAPNNPVISGATNTTPRLSMLNVGVLGGSGVLTVNSGGGLLTDLANIGRANLATVTGTVDVTGEGSTWDSNRIHVGLETDAEGDITVSAGGLITVNQLIVGDAGTGTFSVLSGSSLQSGTSGTVDTIIGNGTGSTGTFVVSGEGSVWNSNSNLIVGGSGTGELSILERGLLESTTVTVGNNTGSSGSISVSGAGSVWNSTSITLGVSGTAELTVADGGIVRVEQPLLLAEASASTGTLNIGDGGAAGFIEASAITGGAGSAVLNFNHNETDYHFTRDGTGQGTLVDIAGSTEVRHSGSGTTRLTGDYGYAGGTTVNAGTLRLDGGLINHAGAVVAVSSNTEGGANFIIQNGGVVNSLSGQIAEGSVAVTGLDSMWTNIGALQVGVSGAGSLTVDAGGQVSSASGSIGESAAGSALVSGAGSSWAIGGNLTVGNLAAGDGTLTIADAGVVSATGLVTLASDGASTGELNIGDGAVAGLIDAAEITGGAGTAVVNFNHSDASYLFTRDGTATGDAVVIDGSAVVNHIGSGTTVLSGANTYTGGTTVNAGTLRVDGVGASISHAGAATTVGAVADDDGTLVIENGAVVTNANGVIGRDTGAQGAVLVSGADSQWINQGDAVDPNPANGSVVVGSGGTGMVTVAAGGAVRAGSLTLASAVDSVGVLNVGAGEAAGLIDADSVTGGDGSAVLNFNHTDANYFFTRDGTAGGTAVVIGGTAAVNQLGSGTTVLSDANTYTGATNVGAGVLRAGAENAFGVGSATTVAAGATLDANNFSQALGSLAGGGQVLLGTATLTTGGSGADSLFSGVIAGDGDVVKTAAGAMILTGENTYLGGTTIAGGTLQIGNGGTTGSIMGNVANDGVLTFNRADDLAFGGVISGAGELNQNGAGTLELTADSPDFLGPTAVNSGRLLVNGGIAGSVVTVNSGGILGGTGVVGGIVTNGGTVAPGNPIGTLSVSGNVDFTGGGVYQVDANATASDRIQATGAATLGGGSVSVVRLPDGFVTNKDYTILTADGGLAGAFDAVGVDSLLFEASLRQELNNVILNLSFDADTFTGLATTSNQQAVANVLAQLAGNPDLADIFDNLIASDAAGIRRAFETLNGSEFTNALHLGRVVNRQFESLLFSRLNGSSLLPGGGNAPVALLEGGRLQSLQPAYASPTGARGGGASADAQAPERGFWARAMGGFGEIDSTRSEPGADFDYTGLALGFDTELPARVLPGTDVIVGGAFGYTTSDAEVGDGDLDADGFHLAAYSRLRRNNGLYLNAIAGYGRNDIDSKRSVVVGSSTSEAKANFDSSHINLALEGGKDFPWQKHSYATPFVGLEYTRFSRDGFTEKGAGVANLTVDDDNQNSLRSVLGGRLSYQFVAGSARSLVTPTVELAYVREFLDDDSRVTAGFAAAPGATFKVEGPSLDRNRLRMGAGLAAQLSGDTSLHFGYQGEFAGSDDHHSFAATFRKTW